MNDVIVVCNKESLISILDHTKEKVEIDQNTVMNTYFNPDSNNGCQIVVNIWDTDRILDYVRKDLDNNKLSYLYLINNPKSVMELINRLDLESESNQCCYDIELNEDGSIEYVSIVEEFLGKPVMSLTTWARLKKEFDDKTFCGAMNNIFSIRVKNNYSNEVILIKDVLIRYEGHSQNLDFSWSELFKRLLCSIHEAKIGPYSEISIDSITNDGPVIDGPVITFEDHKVLTPVIDKVSELIPGVDCELVNRVNEAIRSFDVYSYMDAGTDEENYKQIVDDIYGNCAKETLRTLGEILMFEKENGEPYEETEILIQDVATEMLVNEAAFVNNSVAADVMAEVLMDDQVSTYSMFDDLQYMYLAANKECRSYIDRTLTILTGHNMRELAGQIVEEGKREDA